MKKFFIHFKKKGYEYLKINNKLSYIENIKYNFEENFNPEIQRYENQFNYKIDPKILKLYFLNQILNKRFNEYVLFSYGFSNYKKIFFPAPLDLIDYIISLKTFKVDKKISLVLWQLVKLKFLLISILEVIKLIRAIIFKYETKDLNKYKKTFYFSSLGDGNFDFNEASSNVFTWFRNNFNETKNNNLILIVHSNFKKKTPLSFKNFKIKYKSYPFFVDNNLKKKSKLINKYLKVILYNLLKFFSYKNDSNIILLKEYLIYLTTSTYLMPYDKFLFNNSDYLSRPFWTFDKNIDNKIFFYFYSVNYFKFIRNKFSKFPPGYQSMIWPNYIFWNKMHQSHFKYFKNNYHFIIKEPVSFSDNSQLINIKGNYKKVISLFNVQPLKKEFYIDYCLYGIDDYYNEKNCINFYEDLINFFSNNINDTCILFKEKRRNEFVSYRYRKYIEKLSLNNNIIRVNEDFSVNKIISLSDIIFSLPFSSTSVFAQSLGKLSFYYDPTGKLIQKDSPFNIKILNTKNLLEFNEI